MNRFEGCKIDLLGNNESRTILNWAAGSEEPGTYGEGLFWLLAHCYDGVTWGRIDKENLTWQMSYTPFPDLCPRISEPNLLELRLFGIEREILIWRTETGFSGRCLVDEPINNEGSPTKPDEEDRILLGDRIIEVPKDGFTRVGSTGGAQQAVPLECRDVDFKGGRWPLRLKVRHYFDQDSDTGAVRVAASRLVNVFKEIR